MIFVQHDLPTPAFAVLDLAFAVDLALGRHTLKRRHRLDGDDALACAVAYGLDVPSIQRAVPAALQQAPCLRGQPHLIGVLVLGWLVGRARLVPVAELGSTDVKPTASHAQAASRRA